MSQGKWKKETISELSRKHNIKRDTLYRRIKILKWDKQTAVNLPLTTAFGYKKYLKKQNDNIG